MGADDRRSPRSAHRYDHGGPVEQHGASPEKYDCSGCGKRRLAAKRPPIRWQGRLIEQLEGYRKKYGPQASVHVCHERGRPPGPLACSETCAEKLLKPWRDAEEDLKELADEEGEFDARDSP